MQVNDLAKWIDELQGSISVIKQQLAALSGSVSDVPDFNITTPTAGQILSYDSDHSKFVNADLPEIPDFEITTPTAGQVLTYDETLEKWKNASGGSGSRHVVLYEQEYGAFPASITLNESYKNFDALVFCLYKFDDSSYYDLFDTYVDLAVIDDAADGAISGKTNVISLSGWQIQSGHSQWARFSVTDETTLTKIGNDGSWGMGSIIGIKF